MAGVVVLISSSNVRPLNTSRSDRTKVHLTPFDLSLLQLDYPQRGLFFPKPSPDFHLISRLKASLSVALEIYGNTVSFFIDCDDSGARFHHAVAKTLSLSDLLQPDGSVPDLIKHFFPADDFKNCDGVTEPLLALQVTEMKDGVALSYCYNHLVADGVSMWNFLHAWSKICSSGSSSPLVLKEWFLKGIDYPIHIPVSEAEKPPPSFELSNSVPVTKEKVFHFTKKNISYLKAKANSEVSSSDMNFSSLQAVSAHMWRSVIRDSGLSRGEETYCKVAVGLRQRLNPPHDKDCFGNMAYLVPAIATVEELLDRGLVWTALQIRELVSSQTNENCNNYAEEWVRNVKNLKSGVGSRIAGDTIVVSSSPRFDVYNNVFGWGKPIAVRAGPGNNVSGKLVFFPGIDERSIDVQATLWCDVLTSLLADVEFLEHVTTKV